MFGEGRPGGGLVGWWHMKRYRDVIEGGGLKLKTDTDKGGSATDQREGDGDAGKEDPYDFFARELERMGWGVDHMGSVAGDEEDDEVVDEGLRGKEGGSEWQGGGLLRGEGYRLD